MRLFPISEEVFTILLYIMINFNTAYYHVKDFVNNLCGINTSNTDVQKLISN